jgi:hypothetical protein
MAEAQREIQAVPGHVDPVVVREETEIDEGVLGLEVAKVLQQPPGREGADAAERDHFLVEAVREPVERRTDPREGFREHRHERQRFVRQGEPTRQSPKERHAQDLFETFDLMADRCLRDAQLQPCPGEAEVPRRGFESP